MTATDIFTVVNAFSGVASCIVWFGMHMKQFCFLGLINVEWLPIRHLDFPESGPSPWMKKELSKICNNSYVRVHGDINLLGCLEPHVSAFFVSALDIQDEIFYHDIQVAEMLILSQPTNFADCQPTASFDAKADIRVPDGVSAQTLSTVNMEQRTSEQHRSIGPGGGRQGPTIYSSGLQQNAASKDNNFVGCSVRKPVNHFVTQSNQQPLAHPDFNRNAQSILDVLKNMSSFKPHGLGTEELLTHLVGRGLSKASPPCVCVCVSHTSFFFARYCVDPFFYVQMLVWRTFNVNATVLRQPKQFPEPDSKRGVSRPEYLHEARECSNLFLFVNNTLVHHPLRDFLIYLLLS